MRRRRNRRRRQQWQWCGPSRPVTTWRPPTLPPPCTTRRVPTRWRRTLPRRSRGLGSRVQTCAPGCPSGWRPVAAAASAAPAPGRAAVTLPPPTAAAEPSAAVPAAAAAGVAVTAAAEHRAAAVTQTRLSLAPHPRASTSSCWRRLLKTAVVAAVAPPLLPGAAGGWVPAAASAAAVVAPVWTEAAVGSCSRASPARPGAAAQQRRWRETSRTRSPHSMSATLQWTRRPRRYMRSGGGSRRSRSSSRTTRWCATQQACGRRARSSSPCSPPRRPCARTSCARTVLSTSSTRCRRAPSLSGAPAAAGRSQPRGTAPAAAAAAAAAATARSWRWRCSWPSAGRCVSSTRSPAATRACSRRWRSSEPCPRCCSLRSRCSRRPCAARPPRLQRSCSQARARRCRCMPRAAACRCSWSCCGPRWRPASRTSSSPRSWTTVAAAAGRAPPTSRPRTAPCWRSGRARRPPRLAR